MPESEIVVDGAVSSDDWKKGEKESKAGDIEGGAIIANVAAVVADVQRLDFSHFMMPFGVHWCWIMLEISC